MTTKKFSIPLSKRLGRDVFFNTSNDLPQIVELDLGKIRPNPDQPRKSFSEEGLAELARSIERHGLIQPITVKRRDDGDYLLVAGERRYRAFERLGRESIAAIITTGDPEEIALIENIQREDLNPLEEAQAIAAMMERHRYTQEQIGQVIGKAQNTVSEFLGLLRLPEAIRDEYMAAPIASKSILVEIARIKDEPAQIEMWRAIKEGRLKTVTAARGHPRADRKDPPSHVRQALDTGNRFVRALDKLAGAHRPEALTLAEEEYQQFLTLRAEIDRLFEQLSRRQPDETD